MIKQQINLFNDFTLDLARGCVTRGGEPVHLRPQSYEVLKYLVENSGHLISKDTLIDEVWHGRAVTDGSLGKCIEEIRDALGSESRQYVRNVRGRGYIFDPEVVENGKTVAIHSETVEFVSVVVDEEVENGSALRNNPMPGITRNPVGSTDVRTPLPFSKRKKMIAIALLALPLLIAPVFLYARYWSPASQIESIAVMPFVNDTGKAEFEYLSEGMTETLINSLSRIPNLSVKARNSVFRFKGTNHDAKQIGSKLSVQAILNGRLVQNGDRVTVSLSLVDTRTDNQLWGEKYERKMTDFAAMQNDIARDVSENLRARLTSTQRLELTKQNTVNTEAYRAYLKGRYYWSKPGQADYEKSREYFQQAIDLDPTYAQGWSGLAHYYGFSSAQGGMPPNENWPKSEAAIKKALELDSKEAEFYNALAGIQLYFHRDWAAAENSFRRGIEVNPNAAEVHHHYARCLLLFGRNEEALSEMLRTIDLDPLSLRNNLHLGHHFFFLRRYDEAIVQYRKTLELEPKFAAAHEWLGYALQEKGLKPESMSELITAFTIRNGPEAASQIERTFIASGYEAAFRNLARARLQQLDEEVKRGEYVAAFEYMIVYTRLGERDKALEWLEKVAQERNRFALEFKINPLFDSLRDEPRFKELAAQTQVVQ